jgi:signal transduction histidine kinase
MSESRVMSECEVTESSFCNEQTGRLVAMGQMAASLAHEIRNPLGSMELYCSVLRRELKGEDSNIELLEHIQRGISTLNHIVGNCLMFTKDITVKKQDLNSASTLLRETCTYVNAGRNNVEVSEIYKDNSCTQNNLTQEEPGINTRLKWGEIGREKFSIDPYIIGQVLINLLNNALDACCTKADRDIMHTVSVLIIHDDKEEWSLIVKDTGHGLTEEIKKKIYDPFFTTKEKGTGLGLAIVHSLVSAHRGTIEVISEVGSGTEVKIVFKN